MIELSAGVARTVAAQALPLTPLGTQDLIGIAVFGAAALLFVVLAVLFIVKSRRKRIAELTEALTERPLPEGVEERAEQEALPPPAVSEEPAGAPPSIDERVAAIERKPAASEAERRAKAETERAAKAEAGRKERAEAERAAEVEAEREAQAQAERLRDGLKKTRTGFVARISNLFGGGRAVDADLLEELEQILVTSDVGVKTADHLLEVVKGKVHRKEVDKLEALKKTLKDEVFNLLNLDNRPLEPSGQKPYVVMVVGVNGGGKTTTIGKVAHQLKEQGHQVVLGAGDTFRAAAADQLVVWAGRAGVEIVRGNEGQDPSSVLFDAVQYAGDKGADVVIADTAGRLHTKVNLMEELKKVHRVLGKACAGAPHDVLLVLDATTGQNAIAQAKQFNEAIPLTGLVLTKLDGTAKGGVIVGICQEFGIPVRYIGIGEKIDDLRRFEAREFVDALFDEGGDVP